MATVLVVDTDEKHNRRVRKLLRLAGFATRKAVSLEDAEAMIRAKPPDLVIMDLFLPARSGLMFIRHMHKDFPSMPIIAMSAQAATAKTDYHRLAMDCGAAGVLSKPVSKLDLIAMAKDSVNNR